MKNTKIQPIYTQTKFCGEREREREREIFSEQKEHVYQNLMQKEQHFSEHIQLELE